MSFISVEPQSRVLLENYSNGLLAQFDTQLEIITDRYLAFFKERRSIEATYINSLRELHRKAKTVDAAFDPRAEPTTTRATWDKIRDNLERATPEANTQQAFVDILDNDVIKPLTTLKASPLETEDQTRKRIEEDLNKSAANYADYAENTISKLQQAYFRKYHPRFGGNISAPFRGRQEVLRELEPAKSVGGTTGITHGSQLVSDDDCKWAVSHLNSLRLQRAENLRDGYDCLEELVFSPTVKNVLVKYMDGMTSVLLSFCEIFEDSAEVEKGLARPDTSDLRASFRRALSLSIPPCTLYRNYHPSAHSDSIFGVPLVDVTTRQDSVPKVIRMCIEEVEKRGLNTKKIYSLGFPIDAEVLQLRRRFDNEKTFSFKSTNNIHSVAMLLWLYLLDLPEPLFMLSLRDYRQYAQNRARYTENDFSLLQSKIGELHPVHRASLGTLLRHLLRVSSHSDKNAMTVEALATRFSYTVLRTGNAVQGGVDVKKLVMEDLIQNAHALFDEHPSPSPPPLVNSGVGCGVVYTGTGVEMEKIEQRTT
ncbi:Rho GTPase activation protein [Lactarius vividus]|nr:Rho GTPase activation protein [Lactarius vividus]